MTGKRLIKMTAAAALTLAVVFSASVRPVPAKATTLSQLQQKQAQLQQQSKSLDSQLSKLKNDKAQQQKYRDALAAKAQNLEDQIDSKDALIQQLDADILTKQNQIAAKQKDIDADFQKLKQRVYALYLTGEASNLEIILNAKNVMDLADKSELLQVISKHDTDLMNAIKNDMNSIAEQKKTIEQNRKTASEAKTALEQNQQQLNVLAEAAAKAMASLNQNQQEVEAAKTANEQEKSSVNQWLSNYFAADSGGTSNSGSSVYSTGSSRNMISVAEQYLYYPYVPGGSTPKTSFDCSGFVSWVLNNSGYSVGRKTVRGLHKISSSVSSSEARPGDLIFYNDYGHVGIYLGGGKAIQSDSSTGVRIVTLSQYWADHIDSYGRIN